MGNSNSQESQTTSSTSGASHARLPDPQHYEMTSEERKRIDKLYKSLQEEQNTLEPIINKLKRCEEKEFEEIETDTYFGAMAELVQKSQASSSELLKQMKEPIEMSADAYSHFKQLLNSGALQNHPKRVKGAQKVYEEYWRLLLLTKTQLTKVSIHVKKVLSVIDRFEKELQYSESKIASPIMFRRIIKVLMAWYDESQKIADLGKDWQNLANLANDEHRLWKEIEQKAAKKWTVFKKVLKGLAVVGTIVGVCTALCCFAGPIGIICIHWAVLTWPEIALIAGLGSAGAAAFSYAAKKSYDSYKNAKRARAASKDVSNKINYIASVMEQINKDATKMNKLITDLSNDCEKIKGSMDILKDDVDDIEQSQSQATILALMEGIHESMGNIKTSMIKFNTDCQICIQTIDDSQNEILNRMNDYNSR